MKRLDRPSRATVHAAQARAFFIAVQSVASAAALFEQLFACPGGLSGSEYARARYEQYERREDGAQNVRFACLRQVTPFLPNWKPSPRKRVWNQPRPSCVSSLRIAHW